MTAIAMAFLALVAIKAMAASPWAVFSIGMTIPIALIMGCYQRSCAPAVSLRPRCSGFVLLVLDIVAGGWIASIPAVAALFTLDAKQLVIALVIYSFAAAAAALTGCSSPLARLTCPHADEDRHARAARHRHHHRQPVRQGCRV